VGRFPTEMELTTEFDVSRATVREAIRRLKDEGLLDARRGSGTFVIRRQLDQVLIGSPSLAREIVAAGLEEESKVLIFREGPADDAAAAALGVAEGSTVLWLERIRTADSRPLALDRSALALPEEARASLLAADLGRGSLYDALAACCGIQVTGATEQVRAVTCSPSERDLLGLKDAEGVFEVERVAYAGSTPVEWRRSRLRGDAYVLSASWGVVPERL
jgi:GntR family transcriptional regulator